MTQDEIIEMARKAKVGCDSHYGFWVYQTLGIKELEAFAQLVTAKERKACAKVCETFWDLRDDERARMYANKCADAIRARGEA